MLARGCVTMAVCQAQEVWPAYKRFPEASLHEVLGLVRLTKRTSSLPWATL